MIHVVHVETVGVQVVLDESAPRRPGGGSSRARHASCQHGHDAVDRSPRPVHKMPGQPGGPPNASAGLRSETREGLTGGPTGNGTRDPTHSETWHSCDHPVVPTDLPTETHGSAEAPVAVATARPWVRSGIRARPRGPRADGARGRGHAPSRPPPKRAPSPHPSVPSRRQVHAHPRLSRAHGQPAFSRPCASNAPSRGPRGAPPWPGGRSPAPQKSEPWPLKRSTMAGKESTKPIANSVPRRAWSALPRWSMWSAWSLAPR